MRLIRISISMMIAVAGFLAFTAAHASAASPCAPGQPYGAPPGRNNGQTRPPQYPLSKCDLQLSASAAAAGSSVTASGNGFKPNSGVELTLGSVSVGQASTDSNGSFTKTFTVPADTKPGSYSVAATGVAPSGDAFQQTAALQVTAPGTSPAKAGYATSNGSAANGLSPGAGIAGPAPANGVAAPTGSPAAATPVPGEVAGAPLQAQTRLSSSNHDRNPYLYGGAAAILLVIGGAAVVAAKRRKASAG